MSRHLDVSVVIPAKNSERFLPSTLASLETQTLKPKSIFVVDDGSNDDTGKVAEKQGARVIRLPDIGRYAAGTPHLAEVINRGMEEALDQNPDYVMISGSDDIFPRTYIEKIIEEMEKDNKLVMASGYVAGEAWASQSPRGGGRIIRICFLRTVGLYPLNFGWEAYLVFKVFSLGLRAKTFPIPFHSSRPSSRNMIKYYYLGKGMKALCYWQLHAIGRILLTFLNHPAEGCWMLSGYMSRTSSYEDLRNFVPDFQKREFFHKVRQILSHSKYKML